MNGDGDIPHLLQQWSLPQYIHTFKVNNITISTLSMLDSSLVKEVIHPIGDRAKFLKNLDNWNKLTNPEECPEIPSTSSSPVSKIWRLARYKLTNTTRCRTYSQVEQLDDEASEMSPRTQASCLGYNLQFLRQMRSVKFFFLVSCTSFAFFVLWLQLATRPDQPAATENLIQDALENVGRDYRYKDVYRKATSLPKDFKYILLWTQSTFSPLYYHGGGQRAFLKHNCSVIKCFVTTNRKFFGGDLTKFDAIVFDGIRMKEYDLPRKRSPNQPYIFFNMESADNFPVCGAKFDGFFNWTSTYRLDSDIPYPYILIRDKKGDIVGPKRDMHWKEDYVETIDDQFADRNRLQNKTKAAAWFVSNCKPRSGRLGYVTALKKALKQYGFTVDIYGKCGTLKCPKNVSSNCNYMLKNEYYFYMSMENSFDEDYVTEKLVTALQNDVVPIVYGGADYSRFLPPGSYIDGRKQHVIELASMMNKLIQSPNEYNKYFRWKHHYTYHNTGEAKYVCAICEALHNKKMLQKSAIYDDFRHWWNPNYEPRCPKKKMKH